MVVPLASVFFRIPRKQGFLSGRSLHVCFYHAGETARLYPIEDLRRRRQLSASRSHRRVRFVNPNPNASSEDSSFRSPPPRIVAGPSRETPSNRIYTKNADSIVKVRDRKLLLSLHCLYRTHLLRTALSLSCLDIADCFAFDVIIINHLHLLLGVRVVQPHVQFDI